MQSLSDVAGRRLLLPQLFYMRPERLRELRDLAACVHQVLPPAHGTAIIVENAERSALHAGEQPI